MRQPQIEDNQIDAREIGAHTSQELHGTLDSEGRVPGAEQRRRAEQTRARELVPKRPSRG
jgi:hypothetical protein